ncbi:MAG: glycosyltransferase [Patescibacteria group bacterium]|nr:glycosyltransferase [Patescibacteria group bacterium]
MDYPPMRGGVARYLSNLAEASGGQIKLIVPLEHPGIEFRDSSFEIRRAKFWWSGWPKWLPLIKRCLELKDGIIFVSHVVPVGTAAWISSILGGPQYIILFHGTDLQRMRTRWKRWLLRRICRKAIKLVVNSQATAKALKTLVPGSDPLVLTPGVLPNSVQGDKRLVRQKFGISEQTKVILSVCRLVERKGVDTLLQAVAGLQDVTPDLELVIIGQGPYSFQLHQLAELLKVQVRWVEDASDQEVKEWYSAADVFCLPSREALDDVEGFGIVFLEAAMAGLPVIAGRGWGTEEAVVDDVTGLVVPPDVEHVTGALDKLLNNDQLRRQLGEAGKARAIKDFKWEDRWEMLKAQLEARSSKLDSDSRFEIQRSGDSRFDDIAVVIPCWNHAKILERTLEAMCHQTIQPKEIVVVDNNSNDNPGDVVERFKSRLPVSCVIYKEKQGAPASRNEGARLTNASFLLFLDADVELKPEALEVMRAALDQHPEATFAYSDFFWGHKLFKGRDWDPEALKRMNWIHTSSLIRREAWVPFDESLKRFQDWDLWLTLAEQGKKGVWIPKALFKVTEAAGRKGKISSWLPAFVHRMPWPILGWMPGEVKRYKEAENIIKQKHHL